MMPEFHDDWDELAIVRAREKTEKTLERMELMGSAT
jgi:hypothetical protein